MPRHNNKNRKGNKGSTKKHAKAAPAPAVEAQKAPVVLSTPAEVQAAPNAAVPCSNEEIASKGRIRQVIESEHVENAVSYLSGYAPALVNFYGSVKEQLPETLKTHVDTLENDYVVPTAKKSFDVANTIVDQVDSHLGKAEETVILNLESTRATVETTKEIVYTNVESTKQVVLSNVESTKQVVLSTVVSTVGTGLDKLEGAVAYILLEEENEAATKEDGSDDAVEPKESNEEINARVRQLSAKLVKRLEKLSLVAAIHKARSNTAKAMTERYSELHENFVVPSQSFLNEKYEMSEVYLKEKRKFSEEFLVEKFNESGLQDLSTITYQKLNETVIEPTSAFVEGFKLELKGNKTFENLPKTKDELIAALVEGYGLVQSKVLLPAATYAGVGETFKVYEEFLINKVFGNLVKSVKAPLGQESGADSLASSGDSDGPEVWHDAPARFENDKLVPLYPDD